MKHEHKATVHCPSACKIHICFQGEFLDLSSLPEWNHRYFYTWILLCELVYNLAI